MRARRVIFGLVALGALAALALGLTGVLGRNPTDSGGAGKTVVRKGDEITLAPFLLKHGSLTIRAHEGRMTLKGDTTLLDPMVEMTIREKPGGASGPGVGPGTGQVAAAKVTTLRGRADRGYQSAGAKNVVRLQGNVVVRVTGAREGVVRGEDLTWNAKTRTGLSKGKLDFEFKTQGGVQRGSCRGAEWDLARRRGAMISDARLVLVGWGMPGPASQRGKGKPPAGERPPVHVDCDGRVTIDEAAGEATLNRNVRARQAASRLWCDRMELKFDSKKRGVREVVATGRVRFRDAQTGLSGAADRLVRRGEDGAVTLAGKPACRVSFPDGELVAPKLLLRGSRVESEGRGKMTSKPSRGAGAEARRVSVEWREGMVFLRDKGVATFRGGVVFTDGANRMTCREMAVKFGGADLRAIRSVEANGDVESRTTGDHETGAGVVKCRRMVLSFGKDTRAPENVEATGGVSFESREGKGSGAALTIEPQKDRVRLVGAPAVLEDAQGRRFTGREILIDRKAGVVESFKPGFFVARIPATGGKASGLTAAAAQPAKMGKGTAGPAADKVRAEWRKHMRYGIRSQRIRLQGGVRIQRKRQVLATEDLEVRLRDEWVLARGKGLLTADAPRSLGPGKRDASGAAGDTKKPSKLKLSWTKSMEYLGKERRVVFTGAVKLRQDQYNLEAQKLTVFLDEEGRIARGLGEGSVRTHDSVNGYRGRGEKMEWDQTTGVAKLWGTKKRPAELIHGRGVGVLADVFIFSDDFRKVSMKGMRHRPSDDEE